MNPTIKLPDGHKWKEVQAASSAETEFQCERCYATFAHDMIDNSQVFQDGDGTCQGDED